MTDEKHYRLVSTGLPYEVWDKKPTPDNLAEELAGIIKDMRRRPCKSINISKAIISHLKERGVL